MVSRDARSDDSAREGILRAGLEAFSSHGFAGARVDQMAVEAGVNKALIYYYFKSKKGLYEATLLHLFEVPVAEAVRLEGLDLPPVEKLRALYVRLAGHFAANPALPRIMMRELLSGGVSMAPKAARSLGRVLQFVRNTVAEGVARGQVRDVDPLLFHITMMGPLLVFYGGVAFRGRLVKSAVPGYPVPSDAHVVAHIADMLDRGLRPESHP
jgi:TetR/AcrR family transcriptional regulator